MTILTMILLAICDLEGGTRGQCVGPMGIKPVYVAEVNSILGRDEFTLADRESRVRSLQMARIMFGHYAKPDWTVRDYLLLHKKGATGMKRRLTEKDKDYIQCGENLVRAMQEGVK